MHSDEQLSCVAHLYLSHLQFVFPLLDLNIQILSLLFYFILSKFKLFPQFLIGLLQTCYGVSLLYIGLLHLGVIMNHLLMLIFQFLQIIAGILVEFTKFIILNLQTFRLFNNLFCLHYSYGQILIIKQSLHQLPLNCNQLPITFL